MNKISIDSKKVGISTNVFKNPKNISNLVGMLAANFDVIEIEIENEFREEFADPSYAQKQSSQLNFIKDFINPNVNFSFHAPYIGEMCDIASDNDRVRKNAVKYLASAIDFASEVGSEKITIHPGYVKDKNDLTNSKSYLTKSLRELNQIAEEKNINILLENTGDERPLYILLNDQMHIEFCEKFSNVFLTVDLVHYNSFFRFSEQFHKGLKDMMPYIKNIHFADIIDKQHCHLPLGFGNLDYKSDLTFMVENGYKDNFIVEETVKDYFSYEYLKEVLNFKKEIQ